jgi:hypothetical protein
MSLNGIRVEIYQHDLPLITKLPQMMINMLIS